MKKKAITTLATLVTAAIVLIGGYISQNDSDNLPQGVTAHSSATQSSASASKNSQKSTTSVNSSANSTDTHNSSGKSTSAANSSNKNNEELESIPFPDSLIKTKGEGIVPLGFINANVTKVTDGDTFYIKYNNKEYKVRMLDIDTPESVKSGVEPQPYALEASDFTKKMMTGKKVKLVFEKETTDQYGRLLAHVILENGTYYNAFMVQNGYAISVFYSPNTLLKDYFNDLQSKAVETKKGFWQLPENERPFIENSKGKLVAKYKLKSDAA